MNQFSYIQKCLYNKSINSTKLRNTYRNIKWFYLIISISFNKNDL